MDRKVLGRGLEALISTDSTGVKERIQTLKLQQIQASPFQPRQSFSKEKIEELAQSIKEKGVIQPVIVRALDNDHYELIAGERRLRAVKHLGLDEIPAIVRRVADADVLEMAIVENIQREDLNPIDEAKAYRRLATEFGFTQDAVAQRVGKDKASISNLLRLLNLPNEVQDLLLQNLISFGHARALLSFEDSQKQIQVCKQIIQKGLSVRQIESMTQRKTLRSASRIVNKDIDIRHLENEMQKRLGTKVRVRHGKKRGRIEIEYYSLDDLDRVLKILGVQL